MPLTPLRGVSKIGHPAVRFRTEDVRKRTQQVQPGSARGQLRELAKAPGGGGEDGIRPSLRWVL